MNLGKVIKDERTKKNIRQTELCKKTGLTQTAISLIENGVNIPSNKTLNKISEALEIPVPILQWKSIELEDIPEHRKSAFKQLKPSIDGLIEAILVDAVQL